MISKKTALKFFGMFLNTVGLVQPRLSAQLALKTFRTPRKGRLKPHHRAYLDQLKRKSIDLEHDQIAYYFEPNKKDGLRVLLCHGWESNSFRWRKVLKYFASELNIRFYCLDAPAHGDSSGKRFDAHKYAQFIKSVAEKVKPHAIVGHSFGGFSSLYYMYQNNPTFIEKIIILASPDRLSELTEQYFDWMGLSHKVRNAYAQLIKEVYHEDVDHFASSHFASNLNVPGLVVHDEEDQINGYHGGLAIHNSLSNSKLYTTNGLGHSLQDEEVFEQMRQFLLNP